MKFIMTHNGIRWYVDGNGKLTGHRESRVPLFEEREIPIFEFWIGNPPAPEDQHHSLFVAVLDFAAAQGIVRKIHSYALT